MLALLLSASPPVRLSAQLPPIAVERRLAVQLGLRVGDTVLIGPAADAVQQRAVISAVYQPRPDPAGIIRPERSVRLHLPDVADLLSAPDAVDRFGVALQPGVDVSAATAELNRLAFGFRAFPSRVIASQSSQTFLVVSRFHRAIAMITIGAGAVFLLCIMLLKVEERRLDAAVMRFIGVRRQIVFLALLVEASLIALAGSLLGVALGLAGSAATNGYYRRLYETALTFSLVTGRVMLLSIAVSLGLGLAAGALAAWRLVRTPAMTLWGRG